MSLRYSILKFHCYCILLNIFPKNRVINSSIFLSKIMVSRVIHFHFSDQYVVTSLMRVLYIFVTHDIRLSPRVPKYALLSIIILLLNSPLMWFLLFNNTPRYTTIFREQGFQLAFRTKRCMKK